MYCLIYIFSDFIVDVLIFKNIFLNFAQFYRGTPVTTEYVYLPTPLAGGQRKIICRANEISWPPAGGVGMIFSAPVSIFNVLSQGGSFVGSLLAAITHFWGILDSVLNFQCASPRGLILWVTVGCNYSLLEHFGFSLKFSMCYPKGAHG